MDAFPCQWPIALHLLGSGASVAGGFVVGRVVGGGKRVGGMLPSLLVTVTSAQLTNVSCFWFPPRPQSVGFVQPQLFPVLHHHRRTQWAQVKPAGNLSLILNTSFPEPKRKHYRYQYSNNNNNYYNEKKNIKNMQHKINCCGTFRAGLLIARLVLKQKARFIGRYFNKYN